MIWISYFCQRREQEVFLISLASSGAEGVGFENCPQLNVKNEVY